MTRPIALFALSLAFPFETTVALARLVLAGVLDRRPELPIIAAPIRAVMPRLSLILTSALLAKRSRTISPCNAWIAF